MTNKFFKTSLLLGLLSLSLSTAVTVSANETHHTKNVRTHKITKKSKHKKVKKGVKHKKHKKVIKKHVKKSTKKHKKIVKKVIKKKLVKKTKKAKQSKKAQPVNQVKQTSQPVNNTQQAQTLSAQDVLQANRPSIIPATINFTQVNPSTDGTVEHFNDYENITYRVGSQTTNYLPLIDGYKNAINYVYNSSDSEYQNALSQMQAFSDNNKDKWLSITNSFVASQADQDHIVNVHNLSNDDKKDLSMYTADLLNSIRTQMGNYAAIPSYKAQDFADNVANIYTRDNWNIFDKNDHDVVGINNYAKSLGYQVDPTNTHQFYENYGSWRAAIDDDYLSHAPMAAVKFYIWTVVNAMLYQDGGSNAWGHAISLVGISYDYTSVAEGVAVSFDSIGQLHIIQLGSGQLSTQAWNDVVNSQMK